MRNKWFVLMAACLLLAIGMGTAQAYPQLTSGITGLVQTPTAYLVGARTFDLAADYTDRAAYGVEWPTWPIRLVAGISDNAELGGAYARSEPNISGPPDAKMTSVGAKWQFHPEDERGLTAAVGVNYQGFEQGSYDWKLWSVFVVASKLLTHQSAGLTGNLGLAYDTWSDAWYRDAFLTPFVGVEYGTPGGTCIALDYKWKQAGQWTWAHPLFGIVARHPINKNLSVEVGSTNICGWESEGGFFGGIKLQFGGGEE